MIRDFEEGENNEDETGFDRASEEEIGQRK